MAIVAHNDLVGSGKPPLCFFDKVTEHQKMKVLGIKVLSLCQGAGGSGYLPFGKQVSIIDLGVETKLYPIHDRYSVWGRLADHAEKSGAVVQRSRTIASLEASHIRMASVRSRHSCFTWKWSLAIKLQVVALHPTTHRRLKWRRSAYGGAGARHARGHVDRLEMCSSRIVRQRDVAYVQLLCHLIRHRP